LGRGLTRRDPLLRAQNQVSKGIVPDYGAWVRPEEEMWLGRIAKKLARHEYAARGEFVADFRQLLRNARAYNAPGRGTWGMPGARPRAAPPARRLFARAASGSATPAQAPPAAAAPPGSAGPRG